MKTAYEAIAAMRAEIERQLSVAKSPEIGTIKAEDKMYRQGWTDLCEDLLIFLDTLEAEQPGMGLEKEIEEWWQNWASPPRNEYAVFNKEEFINLARHFYELGLNGKK